MCSSKLVSMKPSSSDTPWSMDGSSLHRARSPILSLPRVANTVAPATQARKSSVASITKFSKKVTIATVKGARGPRGRRLRCKVVIMPFTRGEEVGGGETLSKRDPARFKAAANAMSTVPLASESMR